MSETPQNEPQKTGIDADIAEINGLLNTKKEDVKTPPVSKEEPLTQESYEKRIAELDEKEKTLVAKQNQIIAMQEKITAEGRSLAGGSTEPTEQELQKAVLMKNFGGCIEGLDKMI